MHFGKGFTLIELSMVIVIIGLIVAGVVGGQALVENARVLQQVSELQKYETAVNAFRLEYNALPGDMSNADDFWSGALNGDGNGRMSNYVADMYSPALEGLKFFSHLSLAKLLDRSYDGTWQIDVGYPSLKIDPSKGLLAGGGIEGCCSNARQVSVANGTKRRKLGLYLTVSRPEEAGGAFDDIFGVMSPKKAYNIDKKMDDGLARSGRFTSLMALPNGASSGNCLVAIEGDYDLDDNGTGCMSEYLIIE